MLTVATSSTPSTCGDANGTATADPQGGTAPYSYAWDNGQDAKTATGLLAGTYEVTVTDANSCEATATIDVSDEGAPTLSASVTDVDCFGSSTGAVDVTVMGGTAPFDYSWDNNATTEDLTNIPSGTYSLTITDANGCTATITETVDQPEALELAADPVNVSCNGGSDGSCALSVSGGTAPYSYGWSNGEDTEDIAGLSAGDYTVTVTDANGCTEELTITIAEPDALEPSAVVTNVDCFGNATGAINLSKRRHHTLQLCLEQ